MRQSQVVNCCIRRSRHLSRYGYVFLGVWIMIVLIGVIINGPGLNQTFQTDDKSEKSKIEKTMNIFEKWYLSNRRSLLEDEKADIEFDSLPTLNISIKHSAKLEDIIKYFGKSDLTTRHKVIGILDSLVLLKDPEMPELDCERIVKGDKDAILHVKLSNLEFGSKAFQLKRQEVVSSLERVKAMAENCENFKTKRQYITIPLSKEEAAYSIAYIITIHRDLPSFERLLRTIYHPQNIYCIHVDLKTDEAFKKGVSAVTNCFDNVFVASNLTSVRYTHFSRIQADLNCMNDLVKRTHKYPWKYLINLCGQDFPLKTNLEIVRALKNLGGFNNLETFKTPAHKKRRYELHFELPTDPKHDHALMKKTEIKKSAPPHGIEMFAGSAYYIFKRQAVEYMMTDPVLQEFFEWNGDTYSPDEHMWATIQRMFPQLPGSFPPHEKYDLNELQTITRIIKWGGLDTKVYPKCEGRFVRGICVFGCGDIVWLVQQKHLFANKFDPEIDFFAIHCLEKFIRDRTIDQSKKYFVNGFL